MARRKTAKKATKKSARGKKIPAEQRKPLKFMGPKNDSDDAAIAPKEGDVDLAVAKRPGALGTTDEDLQFHLLCQATAVFPGSITQDGPDSENLATYAKNARALVDGIQPRDEIEGMLAVQMAGVHNMAMETLKLAMLGGQTFEGKDANVNRATKMLRTFVAQMEALKKYRTGGQQKVIVEHVNVNAGGQAIVGAINHGGGR